MARFTDPREIERDEDNHDGSLRGAPPQTSSKTLPKRPQATARGPSKPRPEPEDDGRARKPRSSRQRPFSDRPPGDRPTPLVDREVYELRGRTYHINRNEADALRAAGTFRTVRADDLIDGLYQGDRKLFDRDVEHLRTQNLITVWKFRGRPGERLLALTKDARELTNRYLKRTQSQRIYCGTAKLRELEHDAALYRMYQIAAEPIRAKGGRTVRVVLEHELKKSLNRKLEAANRLPAEERAFALESLAKEHDLKLVDGKIPLPDVRVEYETEDGVRAHLDLELVTEHYRAGAIAEKARAGFTLYAPSGFDRSSGGSAGRRVKKHFPSLAAEILSL